jgi:2-methylcitrate dehydratase PrpD
VFDLHGKLANYKAKFDALISAHYVAAAILHDRALTLAQFDPARYDDPTLRRAAAELIEVRPDPAIKGNNCAVEIEMADGTKLTSFCEHPRGSFENPLTRAQIESKFRTYARGVLPDAHAEDVVAAVGRLEDLTSVRKLMDLLRGKTQKAQAA